jgi:hypothetical protein
MNQEVLIVKNLPASHYKLFIDSLQIGSYSGAELAKGVDLSSITSTPQYQQSLVLAKMVSSIRNREFNLRLIKYIEYYVLKKYNVQLSEIDKTKTTLDSIYISRNYEKVLPYFKVMSEKYVAFKPQEKRTEIETEHLRLAIYTKNQPQVHVFKLLPQ